MQITEIDPNKKYVIALPEAKREYALQIHMALRELMKEGNETILVIFGTEVIIIPADQVVGYTTFENAP